MPNLRETIQKLLENPNYAKAYKDRVTYYRNLSRFVPKEYHKITNSSSPWFVHCLAFRMATYSFASEKIFQRLNDLIGIATCIDGWDNEMQNTGHNWSKNYDEFFHFLWMLQCMEYFVDNDFRVRFSDTTKEKRPDLTVEYGCKNHFFVECYVYSKWWFKETFLEDIARLIHPSLRIKQIYNVRTTQKSNDIDSLLNNIGNIATKDKLDIAEEEASLKSPYILKYCGDVGIIFEGRGEYQPSINAHGDPRISAPVYLKEIVNHKENQNDLKLHRPNVLMVNGLGVDFQNIFFFQNLNKLSFKSDSLDNVELFSCGIDEKVCECSRKITVKKLEAGSHLES